ncbi:hypothetical protein [Vibrio chagasii]|uniref:hypothetical protein n=1 Tax=Vibrio chagasii TaxID=170679 RepID=UPI003DA0AA53
MKKSVLMLSMAIMANASASDLVVSDPKTLLPNENVQSFSMADLNGDGVQELVFVTANGELKYSQLISLGNGFLDSSDYDQIRREQGKNYKMNISLNGDNYKNTVVIANSGYLSLQDGINTRCKARMALQNGTIVADSSNGKITLTYVSRNHIAGKVKCNSGKFKQLDEVSFSATW